MTEDPSHEWRERLDGLYAGRTPRDALEEEVVRRLSDDGLLRTPAGDPAAGRDPPILSLVLRVAAGLAIFAVGWGVGRVGGTEPAGPGEVAGIGSGPADVAGAPTYMLLLWTGPGYRPGADDRAAEYGAWARASGAVVDGAELSDERTLVPPEGAGDGGPASDQRVGGYFVLRAADRDAALALARDHPHVRHGGWVELVEVVTR